MERDADGNGNGNGNGNVNGNAGPARLISLICDVNVKWINSFAIQMRKSTTKAALAKQSQCQSQCQCQLYS